MRQLTGKKKALVLGDQLYGLYDFIIHELNLNIPIQRQPLPGSNTDHCRSADGSGLPLRSMVI